MRRVTVIVRVSGPPEQGKSAKHGVERHRYDCPAIREGCNASQGRLPKRFVVVLGRFSKVIHQNSVPWRLIMACLTGTPSAKRVTT